MEITIDQALQKGIEAHQAGKIDEADRYYTAILKVQPNHPDANHNIGVLAINVGKIETALPFLKRALDANPKIVQFWISYIDALIKLDRLLDAKDALIQAKNKGIKNHTLEKQEQQLNDAIGSISDGANIGLTTELTQSVIDLYSNGEHQKALTKSEYLIRKFPNSASLYNIKGAILEEQGKIDSALEAYNRALEITPNHAAAQYNLGNVLRAKGMLKEAIEAYDKALTINPKNSDAYNNMGNVLKEFGKKKEAIEAYAHALEIKPNNTESLFNLASALKGVSFMQGNKRVEDALLSILHRKTIVGPSMIAQAALSLVKCDIGIHKLLLDGFQIQNQEKFEETIKKLAKTELLLQLMSVSPLPDIQFERLLCNLRSYLVENIYNITVDVNLLKVQSALALQCFTNEYVYDISESDAAALYELEDAVSKTLANGSQPTPHTVLCLASFKALNKYDWSGHLDSNIYLKDTIQRQILEPNTEEILKSKIEILDQITDKVSTEVRAQYEENPYPRWVNIGLRYSSASINQISKELELKLSNKEILSRTDPEILIAGCGTGQHSIQTAAQFKNSKVLAIDLSLKSLAYAERKSRELKLLNIDYMQADILNLRNLNRQFDVIESVGVLHHMDDPLSGWTVLVDCLRTGGLMKIGLYSELGRQPLINYRSRIAQSRGDTVDDNIRQLRLEIAEADDIDSKLIRSWRDYFSMSEVRDLLFHVREHHFTIMQIKSMLSQLGLTFCGFEGDDIIHAFKQSNSTYGAQYDLDEWHAFEKNNKGIFRGMYQFWCQKVN